MAEVAHVTRDSDITFKIKGQLVADVLNSQHAGTGATWRINRKVLSTSRGRGILCRHAHSLLMQWLHLRRDCDSTRRATSLRLARKSGGNCNHRMTHSAVDGFRNFRTLSARDKQAHAINFGSDVDVINRIQNTE